MANLYLHLGGPKTGTTALQSFLSLNEQKLRDQGFLYPVTGRSGVAHHTLANTVLNRAPGRGPLYRKLREELQASSADKILISSETFFFLQDQAEEIPALLQGFEVTPVVYFRRQDIWLEAMYTQILKHPDYRHTGDIKNKKVFEMFDYYMDYHKLCQRWAAPFKTKPIVRVYEKSRLPGGIIGDFCDIVGLKTGPGWNMPQSSAQLNLTLSPGALDLLRQVNALTLTQAEHVRFLDILSQRERSFPSPESSYNYLSRKERSALLARYAAPNRDLAHEIGLEDGVLFTEEIVEHPMSQPTRIPSTELAGALALDTLKSLAETSGGSEDPA